MNGYGSDLQLDRRQIEYICSDRQGVELGYARGDLVLVSGKDNIAQAIINRLLTRRGELAGLGHPDYGSRLFQLIGEPQNARSQALAELYIRECLAQDPRIDEIEQFAIRTPDRRSESRERLEACLTIALAADETGTRQTLNLSIPIVL